MSSIPHARFPDDVRARLKKYLKRNSHERPEGIAQFGPMGDTEVPGDAAQFRLICAHKAFDPDDLFAYVALADAYLANGLPDGARQVYESLRDREDSSGGYFDSADFRLGWLEADLGNFETALTHFDACLAACPDRQWEVAFYKGTAYHEMGRFEDAKREYERYCTGLDPTPSVFEGPNRDDWIERSDWPEKGVSGEKFVDAMAKRHRITQHIELMAARALLNDATNQKPFRGRRRWPISHAGIPELDRLEAELVSRAFEGVIDPDTDDDEDF